jgi:RNA polymerase sigma factor (sigma-70 family)
MAALPSRQRQCLTLRVRDELSYAEIAELLRLDALTVRNHIAQAKKSLRARVERDTERRKP